MADYSKEVEILLKFGLDDAAAKKAAGALATVRSESTKTNTQMGGMETAMKRVAQQAGAMLSVAAVMSTLGNAVQNYVNQAQTSEPASRKWLENTQLLDNAWVRVGRYLTETVLPIYETLAKLATIVTTETGRAQFQNYIQGGYKNYPGAGIGQATHGNVPAGDPTQSIWDAISQFMHPGYSQYPMYAGAGGTTARGAGSAPGKISGPGFGGTAGGAAGESGPRYYSPEQLQQFRNYKQQEEQIARQTDITKFKMQRDYNRQELYATQDFNKSLTRSNRDFNIQMQFSEKEFYRQRAITQRDFGIQLVRNEQDFQRQRNRASQDHQFDLYQIAMTGDAMQYWLAERSYNLEKTRSEEDYNINKQRSQEDLQRGLSDSETSYQIQRAQTIRERNISLSDQAEDFQIQRERAMDSYKLALTDMDVSLKEQRLLRQQAFMNQYTDAQTQENAMLALRSQFNQLELDSFQKMIDLGYQAADIIRSAPPAYGGGGGSNEEDPTRGGPQYANGGYTRPGRGTLHAGEFVMTASTTAAAERAARSNQLSQDALVQLFSGGGKGMTYNDHRRFDTAVSAEDRRAIAEDTQAVLLSMIP